MRRQKFVVMEQRANEHSGNVFVRAAKLVRVGQVLRVIHASGGADGVWLKVDARRNAGTAWKTFVGAAK
jgi:hypothetical protein